ncbi:hypothetical protein ACP70R_004776 [Stipagrostis hirtigluma subsp. patula]
MEPEKGGKGEASGEAQGKGAAAAEAAKEEPGVKMLTLTSSEGDEFKVSEAAARLSSILASMIKEGVDGGRIPALNATAGALALVIKYCEKHAAGSDHGAADDSSSSSSSSSSVDTPAHKAMKNWDRELVDGLHQDDLYDLIVAAHFLDIKGLRDVSCQKAADMIKGKTTAQIREIFNIVNDLTPAEEEEIRNKYAWAFDDGGDDD